MAYDNIPTLEVVSEALADIGGQATASVLCDLLVARGYPRPDAQLGIQRTTERGGIAIQPDWQLKLSPARP